MPNLEPITVLVWDSVPNEEDIRSIEKYVNQHYFKEKNFDFDIDRSVATGEDTSQKYTDARHSVGVSLQFKRNIDEGVLSQERQVKVVVSGYKGVRSGATDITDLKNKLDLAIKKHKPTVVLTATSHGYTGKDTKENFIDADRLNNVYLEEINDVLKRNNVSMIQAMKNSRPTAKRFTGEKQFSNIFFVYSEENMNYDSLESNTEGFNQHTARLPSLSKRRFTAKLPIEKLNWFQSLFRDPKDRIQTVSGNSFSTPAWLGITMAQIANAEKKLDQLFEIDLSISHLYNSFVRDFKNGTLTFKAGTPEEVKDELLNMTDRMNEYYRKATGSAKFVPSDEKKAKNIIESSTLDQETDFLDNFK